MEDLYPEPRGICSFDPGGLAQGARGLTVAIAWKGTFEVLDRPQDRLGSTTARWLTLGPPFVDMVWADSFMALRMSGPKKGLQDWLPGVPSSDRTPVTFLRSK